MKTILFLCVANVARSQMAEGFWRTYSKKLKPISAGVEDYTNKHTHPDKTCIELMKQKGIDISQQKVKHVNSHMVESAKKVIVFCQKSRCPQYVLKHPSVYFKHVRDPYGQKHDVVVRVRNQIDSYITQLLEKNILEL